MTSHHQISPINPQFTELPIKCFIYTTLWEYLKMNSKNIVVPTYKFNIIKFVHCSYLSFQLMIKKYIFPNTSLLYKQFNMSQVLNNHNLYLVTYNLKWLIFMKCKIILKIVQLSFMLTVIPKKIKILCAYKCPLNLDLGIGQKKILLIDQEKVSIN